MNQILLIAFSLLVWASLASAQPSGTDIYAAAIENGRPSTEPANLTQREGYDNQPGFTADGTSFYFTQMDSTGQADIVLYSFAEGSMRKLTETSTSEYSGTPMPGSDRFSVVRVEEDGTQRLWSFANDGTDPQLVLPARDAVGYHAWGDETDLLLFVLGEPHELHHATVGQDSTELLVKHIGRCIQKIPGEDAYSFVQKSGSGGWMIRRLDRATGEISDIAQTPDESIEDYCWTPDGRLWSSNSISVLEWRSPHWRRVVKYRDAGIKGISRMAVSPDGKWFVFVAQDGAPN